MRQKLVGKVAVVTGASKGIGASIAQALAEEGASVVVNYSSSKQDAERVVAEIAARGGTAIAVQADVSKPTHIERLFSTATRSFGRLDILVNNAGIYEFSPLEGVTEEHFHKHFNVNVLGLLFTTKEAVKHMGPDGGSIINIGSVASSMRLPNSAVYSASKAAVIGLTRYLASYWGAQGIRVNTLTPGGVESGQNDVFSRKYSARVPMARMARADEMQSALLFLASDASSYMTGQNLVIDGGLTCW